DGRRSYIRRWCNGVRAQVATCFLQNEIVCGNGFGFSKRDRVSRFPCIDVRFSLERDTVLNGFIVALGGRFGGWLHLFVNRFVKLSRDCVLLFHLFRAVFPKTAIAHGNNRASLLEYHFRFVQTQIEELDEVVDCSLREGVDIVDTVLGKSFSLLRRDTLDY